MHFTSGNYDICLSVTPYWKAMESAKVCRQDQIGKRCHKIEHFAMFSGTLRLAVLAYLHSIIPWYLHTATIKAMSFHFVTLHGRRSAGHQQVPARQVPQKVRMQLITMSPRGTDAASTQ